MAISVRIDASALKSEVANILDRKVRSITSNQDLYNELSRLFYTYVISYLPEDTGALKMIGQGYAKNGYYRRPKGTIGGHHGIEFDAVEERPNGDRYYAEPVLRRIFGANVSEGVMNMMMSDGSWKKFCEEAAPIISEAMNNG